jgi:hypothetical protein
MKGYIIYDPVDNEHYQRTVSAFEEEIARLKAELLPTELLSVIERDKQHMIWLELDRLGRSLANLRDKAIKLSKLGK